MKKITKTSAKKFAKIYLATMCTPINQHDFLGCLLEKDEEQLLKEAVKELQSSLFSQYKHLLPKTNKDIIRLILPERYKIQGKVPLKGDKIYVPTQMYIDHGEDDIDGGLATINIITEGISAGAPTYFVTCFEVPGHSWNWDYLLQNQAKWKKAYGKSIAAPNPDLR